jgi:hypothetical protein
MCLWWIERRSPPRTRRQLHAFIQGRTSSAGLETQFRKLHDRLQQNKAVDNATEETSRLLVPLTDGDADNSG